MDIHGKADQRVFKSRLDQALSQAGACLGQTICKLMITDIDPGYMNEKEAYRTNAAPKVFTIEPVRITGVDIVEYHDEQVVCFNHDMKFIFAPGALLSGKTINPMALIDDVIETGDAKYFFTCEEGMMVAEQLNKATQCRMEAVARNHAEYAKAIAKVNQANREYARTL